jgi:hypothetical protein
LTQKGGREGEREGESKNMEVHELGPVLVHQSWCALFTATCADGHQLQWCTCLLCRCPSQHPQHSQHTPHSQWHCCLVPITYTCGQCRVQPMSLSA